MGSAIEALVKRKPIATAALPGGEWSSLGQGTWQVTGGGREGLRPGQVPGGRVEQPGSGRVARGVVDEGQGLTGWAIHGRWCG